MSSAVHEPGAQLMWASDVIWTCIRPKDLPLSPGWPRAPSVSCIIIARINSLNKSLAFCSKIEFCCKDTHGSIPADIETDWMAEMISRTVSGLLPRLSAGLLMARSSSQDSHSNGKLVPLKH